MKNFLNKTDLCEIVVRDWAIQCEETKQQVISAMNKTIHIHELMETLLDKGVSVENM